MVRINNSDLSNELRDVAKIQVGADIIPNILSNQVVPVIDVNPKHSRIDTILVASTRTTTATAASIFAARPNQDVFITGCDVSITQDVVCDGISTFVTGQFDGLTVPIFRINRQPTTAQSINKSYSFKNPLKIDRNSALLVTGAFAAGTYTHTIIIYGYIVDNPNA